jgi:hypothetical protein
VEIRLTNRAERNNMASVKVLNAGTCIEKKMTITATVMDYREDSKKLEFSGGFKREVVLEIDLSSFLSSFVKMIEDDTESQCSVYFNKKSHTLSINLESDCASEDDKEEMKRILS